MPAELTEATELTMEGTAGGAVKLNAGTPAATTQGGSKGRANRMEKTGSAKPPEVDREDVIVRGIKTNWSIDATRQHMLTVVPSGTEIGRSLNRPQRGFPRLGLRPIPLTLVWDRDAHAGSLSR